MNTRCILAIAILALASNSVQAQLPTSRFSPLNYFGRIQGIGWSDGYHECKTGKDKGESWFHREPLSTFYGEPTLPNPRATGLAVRMAQPRTRYYPNSNAYPMESYDHAMEPQMPMTSYGTSPYTPGPATYAPGATSYPPSVQPSPNPAMRPESVTPVGPISPAIPTSPSDRRHYSTPTLPTDDEPLPEPAPAQARRMQGTRSFLQSSYTIPR